MKNVLLDAMDKRKSFHSFKANRPLSIDEIGKIEAFFEQITTLENNKIALKLVKKETTSCSKGEYCINIYADKEDKDHLLNVGYVGEQLDLYLTSLGIGVCWYGFGRTQDKKYKDLDFIIMLNIQKVDDDEWRTDYHDTKRRSVDKFWSGEKLPGVSERCGYAPSSCNTQPWLVEHTGDKLIVSMTLSRVSIIPPRLKYFFHEIDMGIFLLFLELLLTKNGISFIRELENEEGKIATYTLK